MVDSLDSTTAFHYLGINHQTLDSLVLSPRNAHSAANSDPQLDRRYYCVCGMFSILLDMRFNMLVRPILCC